MDPATNETPAAQAAATPAPDPMPVDPVPGASIHVPIDVPSTARLVQNAAACVDSACKSIRSAIAGEASDNGTPDAIAKLTELLRRLEAHKKDLTIFATAPAPSVGNRLAGVRQPVPAPANRIPTQIVNPTAAAPAK